ncbi:MAG: GUN4 N-terminal ARM-like repeat domain-containing protein [Cyanobacteria bacterium P01_D01_bin.105]
MSSNAIESAKSAEDTSQNNSPSTVTNRQSSHQAGHSIDSQTGEQKTGVSAGQSSIDNPLAKLTAALSDKRLKKQLQAIRGLAEMGESGEAVLADFVRNRMDAKNPTAPTAAHGCAYQILYRAHCDPAKALIEEYPEGLVCPQSDKGIDYSDLQMLLVQQDYQQADKLTNQKLCALAGESALERKWVYFTEVSQFPIIDLQAIDIMWRLYSEDKFGWSQQYDLWTRLGQDWERLWLQLQWKSAEGIWTRYPTEFIWDLDLAPVAHLPLSNQLRGVRTMDSLLGHPAWQFPWQPS